nr:hypothetical protein BaRGS_032722 [Batillaria attramentaria]
MSPEERTELLYTLNVFIRACQEHGLTYYLTGGSLVGAYRHHGLIPWDVDVDVLMNVSHRTEMLAALGDIPGFTLEVDDRGSAEGSHRFSLSTFLANQTRRLDTSGHMIESRKIGNRTVEDVRAYETEQKTALQAVERG